MKFFTTSLAILFSVLIFGQGNVFWSSIEVVNSDPGKGSARPRITAVNGNIPVIIWGDKSNSFVYFSRKSSGSWSNGLKLNPSGMTVFASDWAGPELAANGNTVFVSFNALPEKSEKSYVVSSTDGGINFSSPVPVSNNIWTRFPTPAVDENGKPYVAFMEFDSGFVDPHYAVATSSNSGQSFTASVIGTSLAPGEVCDCCPAFLWADLNNVALFFRNNDNNLRDIWASVSNNSSATFTKAADIDDNNWMINSCPSTGPDALIIGDSLIAVWMSGASTKSRINMGTADISGLSIGRNVEINPGVPSSANQNYPRIAGSTDTLGVVWQETGQGKIVIKGLFSTTGIQGLLNADADTISELSDIFQVKPDIAFQNGVFHITWQNSVQNSVLYRTLSVDGPIGLHQINKSISIEVFPNPSSEDINVEVPLKYIGGAMVLRNNQGQIILQKKIIDEKNKINSTMLPNGVYFLTVDQNGSHESVKLFVE